MGGEEGGGAPGRATECVSLLSQSREGTDSANKIGSMA